MEANPPTLVTVRTVYGEKFHVAKQDLENPKRTQLPLYFGTGRKYSDSPIRHVCTTIHRENIAEVL
jgi:hypothetical protein